MTTPVSRGPQTSAIEYPSEDGEPMAETPVHVEAIMLLHQAIQDFFRDRPDVFVASDIFWYWQEGNPGARVSPDVMVVPGVRPRDIRDRRSFFSWEEGGAIPAVVFEMASEGTVLQDLGPKYWQYEELGVREYFLFDPEGVHLVPVLQGFRLNRSAYRRLLPAGGVLESELGFHLRAEGPMLRLIDGRTGQPVPTRAERADAEKARADALAAEVERLKQLLGGSGP
jgi:Uma2 family endonuclease